MIRLKLYKLLGRLSYLFCLSCCAGIFATAGCRPLTPPMELPVASSLVLDELVIYSDFQLPENHRLLQVGLLLSNVWKVCTELWRQAC